MKVVIVNAGHNPLHFGCKLTLKAYDNLLAERDIELIGHIPRRVKGDLSGLSDEHQRLADKADLVIVNAEGSIHHGKNEALLKLGYKYPAVLINGSMQAFGTDVTDDLAEFKIVTVRESSTAAYLAAEFGHRVELVADVIFSFAEGFEKVDRELAIGMFITDSSNRDGPDFAPKVRDLDYLTMLGLSSSACVGRFHALCVSAMLGLPFSAWSANTWKNQGIMVDMQVQHNYYATYRDAVLHVPKEPSATVAAYVDSAEIRVNELFDRIAEL